MAAELSETISQGKIQRLAPSRCTRNGTVMGMFLQDALQERFPGVKDPVPSFRSQTHIRNGECCAPIPCLFYVRGLGFGSHPLL